jgi:hypothetical protein
MWRSTFYITNYTRIILSGQNVVYTHLHSGIQISLRTKVYTLVHKVMRVLFGVASYCSYIYKVNN